jgi:hypothetical protein
MLLIPLRYHSTIVEMPQSFLIFETGPSQNSGQDCRLEVQHCRILRSLGKSRRLNKHITTMQGKIYRFMIRAF